MAKLHLHLNTKDLAASRELTQVIIDALPQGVDPRLVPQALAQALVSALVTLIVHQDLCPDCARDVAGWLHREMDRRLSPPAPPSVRVH